MVVILSCASSREKSDPYGGELISQREQAQSPRAMHAMPAMEKFQCERAQEGGVVKVAADRWANRLWAGVQDIRQLISSRINPVEVCGVEGQVAFLRQLKCSEGVAPFINDRQAYAALVGPVGIGGRCNSIVDLYRVSCPEGRYNVFMDMYVCLADESKTKFKDAK